MDAVLVATFAVTAVTLYGIAFVQIRRALPERATELITEILLTAAGATTAAAVGGYGPLMWAGAPAFVATTCFIAGKGSVVVLIGHSAIGDEGSEETTAARRRFLRILLSSFVAYAAVVVIMEY